MARNRRDQRHHHPSSPTCLRIFKQMFQAIKKNKTGVTTVYDTPYNGNELTNILMNNLRESQDSPINITFEDAMCTWANDLLEYKNHMIATDDTGIENGIFAAYGIPTAMFGMDGVFG